MWVVPDNVSIVGISCVHQRASSYLRILSLLYVASPGLEPGRTELQPVALPPELQGPRIRRIENI